MALRQRRYACIPRASRMIWTPAEGWHAYDNPWDGDDPSGWHTNHVHISLLKTLKVSFDDGAVWRSTVALPPRLVDLDPPDQSRA